MAIVRMKPSEFTLTKEQLKSLNERLDKMTDEDIDCSDIPELKAADWKKAITYEQFDELHRSTS